ncbi:MAG: sigma-70 family RNA polymerase sigma factor [Planctomycetota bacterium]|nr:sigma-70 family RNA polymerase sigma factor [Planctomycetota bacterium]
MFDAGSDRGLLAALAGAGAEEAFARLTERHGGMVYAACRRVLVDSADAEDAAQAAFLVLWRKRRDLPAGLALGAWLHRTALWAARDVRKVRARRARHELEAAGMRTPMGQAGKDRAWSELSPHLDAALEELPNAQREALVLRYLNGYSQAEAARELGCPEETVHTRVRRGLERLRERLARRGVGLSVLALGALLGQAGGGAAPAGFAASIQAACLGKAGANGVAMLTAQEVLKAMFWSGIRKSAFAALLAAAVLAGGVSAFQARGREGELRPVVETQGDEAKPAPAQPEAPRAGPEVNGMRLALTSARPSYALGEAPDLQVEFKNVSQAAFDFLRPYDPGPRQGMAFLAGDWGAFEARIADSEGRRVEAQTWSAADVQGGHPYGAKPGDYISVSPNGGFGLTLAAGFMKPLAGDGDRMPRRPIAFGTRYYLLDRPGIYRIRVVYRTGDSTGKNIMGEKIVDRAWLGEIESNEVSVEIKATRAGEAKPAALDADEALKLAKAAVSEELGQEGVAWRQEQAVVGGKLWRGPAANPRPGGAFWITFRSASLGSEDKFIHWEFLIHADRTVERKIRQPQ